jgi:Flp pilus assembly protein TadD/mono/diheme cytochrome c family protein
MTGSGRPWIVALAVLAGLAASAAGQRGASAQAPGEPTFTFTRDVAPIVFTHCAPCHHAGGAGPFPLTTYAEVRRRARQIVKVTRARVMPPWPPVEGHGAFKGERRLDAEQIATLARWADRGMPEGATADLPAAPRFADGWQLGTPDLVLTPGESWTLPADGEDVFRNFVLPAPIASRRYVRAVEIRPGNARIVHHANALLDRSGVGRERDAAEPGPGFAGMDLEIASDRFEPDSHFLFWKPGTPAGDASGAIPWTLEPGTDLILNLHLRTSGKPEPVRPSLGVYFTEEAPAQFPMLLQLEHDGALDIPAGATRFAVTDELTLPVAVQVLAVYPHAHYVAREVEATARRPDGTTEWLVHIDDWNLDWQAVYELATPLRLPPGSVISMRWTYDNSAANVRNPHTPPRRVVAGNRASDEMSHLWLQVLPDRREDQAALQEALMHARLRKYPGDFVANANLGALRHSAGRPDEAAQYYRAALAGRPDHAAARNGLGAALIALGRPADAAEELSHVARRSPDYLPARYNLGNALLASGRPDDAIPHFEFVLARTPGDAAALSDMGSALAMTGKLDDAARAFRRSLALDPANARAHYNLGLLAARAGRFPEAEAHFARAATLDPADPDAARALAEVRATMGQRPR